MEHLKDVKHGEQMEHRMENKWRSNNWRKHGEIMEEIVLNADIRRILIFNQNVWSAAYDVIWSASTKLRSLRAFRPVVMATVTVIVASLFAAIIIATR